MDDKSRKALQFGAQQFGSVEWSFALAVSEAVAKTGVDGAMLVVAHDGKFQVLTLADDEESETCRWLEQWSDMTRDMLSHPGLLGIGSLPEKKRADRRKACCWEAMIDVRWDKNNEGPLDTVVVRFDDYQELDRILPWEIGWRDVERITIELVNDERAGRLPDIRDQIKEQVPQR